MEARREARRRRILENAAERLKRVVDIQSKGRKKANDHDTCEKDDSDHLRPAEGTGEEEEHTDSTTDKIIQAIERNSLTMKKTDSLTMNKAENEHPLDGNEADDDSSFEQIHKISNVVTKASKAQKDDEVKEGTGFKPADDILVDENEADENLRFGQVHKISNVETKASNAQEDDEVQEGTGFQPDAKALKLLEQRQMVYRMIFIFGLALLLVIVCKLKTLESTRYGEVRKSSFLPYFITLEVVLFCLFPVNSESNKQSLMNLALAIFGLSKRKIIVLTVVLSLATRLFQDFAWFIFTVSILNYYIASF